jgi:hypothetical protein
MSKTTRGPGPPRWRQLSRAHSTRGHGRLKRTAEVSLGGFGEPATGLFVTAICDGIPGAKAIVDGFDSVLAPRS